jgi:hypothetical protein
VTAADRSGWEARAPRSHVAGRDLLAIARGHRPEPSRPYTFDAKGLTADESGELTAASSRYARPPQLVGMAPLARARAGFADSGAHRPCRFCATAASVLAAWADRYGRPVDPLPVRPGRRKAAR